MKSESGNCHYFENTLMFIIEKYDQHIKLAALLHGILSLKQLGWK